MSPTLICKDRTVTLNTTLFSFKKVEEKSDKACCAGKRTCDAVSKENEGSPKSKAKVEQEDKPSEPEPVVDGKADEPVEEKAASDAIEPATAPVEAQ